MSCQQIITQRSPSGSSSRSELMKSGWTSFSELIKRFFLAPRKRSRHSQNCRRLDISSDWKNVLSLHHYINYKNYKNWRHATKVWWGLHKEKYILVCRANIHLYTEKCIFSGQANILLTENYISSRQTNIWWYHTAVTSIQLSHVGAVHR